MTLELVILNVHTDEPVASEAEQFALTYKVIIGLRGNRTQNPD